MDFNFVAGLKFEEQDTKVALLLNSKLRIDSYSSNAIYLFDEGNTSIEIG